jgi:Fe-S oxidoreductase
MLRDFVSTTSRAACWALGRDDRPPAAPDLCCGFEARSPCGSGDLARDGGRQAGRRRQAEALVTADPGCLVHLRGRSEQRQVGVKVVHLATALAQGIDA